MGQDGVDNETGSSNVRGHYNKPISSLSGRKNGPPMSFLPEKDVIEKMDHLVRLKRYKKSRQGLLNGALRTAYHIELLSRVPKANLVDELIERQIYGVDKDTESIHEKETIISVLSIPGIHRLHDVVWAEYPSREVKRLEWLWDNQDKPDILFDEYEAYRR